MSNTVAEPLSPSAVGAHALAQIIMLTGGCSIEWVKKKYQTSLLNQATLDLAELTIFVYWIGGLINAVKWTHHQWTTGKPIPESGRELKQFIPRRGDIKKALNVWRILRLFLVLLISCVLVVIIPGSLSESPNVRNPGDLSGPLLVGWINHYSPYLLLVFGVATLIINGVLLTIAFWSREPRAHRDE